VALLEEVATVFEGAAVAALLEGGGRFLKSLKDLL